MGRDRKEQLGVRVSPGVKAKAVDAAKQAGVSLNQWVEDLICSVVGDIRLPIVPAPGQITIEQAIIEEAIDEIQPEAEKAAFGLPVVSSAHIPEGTVRIMNVATGETQDVVNVPPKEFDPSCRNRAYHWKQSIGNPCRFCGGEM